MMNQVKMIKRENNKFLFYIDRLLILFVDFIVSILYYIVPSKYKERFNNITKKSDIFYNVVGLTFFNAIGGLCVMATQVKLANYLGAASYGTYAYCLAIGEVGAMIVRYGRDKTMLRDLVQYPQKTEAIIVGTFWMAVINLVLFLSVVLLMHTEFDITVNVATILLILSPCLISFDPSPVYEQLRMMGWHSIYMLLQKFCFLIIIWVLFWIGYDIRLITLGVIMIITWLFIIVCQFKEISKGLEINYMKLIKLRELLYSYKNNFSVFLSCAFGIAFGPILNLMLKTYSDSKAVGIYAAGLQIYNICWFLNTQISRVGKPMMAEAGKKNINVNRRRILVRNYLIIMIASSSIFAIPLFCFPNILVDTLYRDDYSTLSNYLPIMGMYLMCAAIGVVFEQFLISLRMDKTYFFIYILSALCTILCAFYMLPRFGTFGAFFALCVPRSIGYLCYAVFALPQLK